MKLQCTGCAAVCTGHTGHIGKKHQSCKGRKKGDGTKRSGLGLWEDFNNVHAANMREQLKGG